MTEFNTESTRITGYKKSLAVKQKDPLKGLVRCKDGCGALVKSSGIPKRCKPCSAEKLIKHNREKYYKRKI